jgi:hypothetical protein
MEDEVRERTNSGRDRWRRRGWLEMHHGVNEMGEGGEGGGGGSDKDQLLLERNETEQSRRWFRDE